MAIQIDEKKNLFTLHTKHSTYQMMVGPYGVLLHLYYGAKTEGEDFSYLLHPADHGFSGNPHDTKGDRTFSLDVLPQEYSSLGTGDYRTPCLRAVWPNGACAADFRFESYERIAGKPALPGLPALYENKPGEAETLKIVCKDRVSSLRLCLLYSVFEETDSIARSCFIQNDTDSIVYLDAAYSCCLDFLQGDYELMNFYGRHTGERSVERAPLRHGKFVAESTRGASSHQQNPFGILCAPHTGEEAGECYGVSLLYSGSFLLSAEKDQFGQIRLVAGIHPDGFRWRLKPGETFQTPEAVLCYSGQGLEKLSQCYHRLYRKNLCRGEYREKRRPILINNWEATYFDFDEKKLEEIAKTAAALGVEMLVVDDGWFGKRDSDTSGLGDWTVNTSKLHGGLPALCARVNDLGMKLGIWFEPEMVSEDSDFYRTHPDWLLHIPGRPGIRSRDQLVLDLSREEVVHALFKAISGILSCAPLEYVKWDMNRHLTDVWSAALSPDQQGEVAHRYVLGVYSLLERLLSAFPHVLFEGCAGGGGRFDAGMLYYTPQIWCSDNTDAIDRILIQYGTSFGYPISSVGSHVSACPNHQTGRCTPLKTRATVAMSGAFGYELDLSKLDEEEKKQIQKQIQFYRENSNTILGGDYYRLTNPENGAALAAWQFVSEDGAQSLVNVVFLRPQSNAPAQYIKPRGLDPFSRYCVKAEQEPPFVLSGSALMHAGIKLAPLMGEYPAVQLVLKRVE